MALRRSRGRGWIEFADRGSVESVARPHHHRHLRRHPRHSRLRSPQDNGGIEYSPSLSIIVHDPVLVQTRFNFVP
ncbi:hypothetical protein FCV25MIE_26831 [Fagus crenata]